MCQKLSLKLVVVQKLYGDRKVGGEGIMGLPVYPFNQPNMYTLGFLIITIRLI